MKLSEFLQQQAQTLRANSEEYVAVSLLKQAGLSEEIARAEVCQKLMEKEAAVALSNQGIDYDEAMKMVKAAGVKISDMASFKAEPSFEEMMASQFEKAASEAQDLESKAEYSEELFEKVASLEEALSLKPEVEQVSPMITKFAESGDFTNEDLQALMKLPSDTLTKVASSQEQPWKMGKSAGVNAEAQMDPFAAWLLS